MMLFFPPAESCPFLETITGHVYNRSMYWLSPDMDQSRRRTGCLSLLILLGLLTLLASTRPALANPDVYAALPNDTRVIQYGMGDIDGDLLEELAVLYTSGGVTSLTLFKARTGRWSRLWTDEGPLSGVQGASPHSVEIVDVNGDGKSEIITYHLTGSGRGMAARIIELDITGPDDADAGVILEDITVPPGYPLFGSENGVPSVTFLRMPMGKGDTGHRRVYCWNGERFEKCLEVPWR
jgi:hypothetical protein